MPKLGSLERPLRVAIIGAGPSAFYAADGLLQQTAVQVSVDMYDRKPTPYGLVRDGVAPDHQKIKSVIRVYEKTASNPNFRFFGNVTFGKDIMHAEMRTYYDAIIYAVGAQTDKKMGIPGEDLIGSYPATIFVAWYNGHPDYSDLDFDLSHENVAVIGQGNVAMDVTRILAKSVDELATTDIADYALEKLRASKVKNIYIIGRRGPAQAAFTNPEIKELGELELTELVVAPADLELDAASAASLQSDKVAAKNVDILRQNAAKPQSDKPRKIMIRFLLSPVELLGENGQVTAIKLQKNVLQQSESGDIKAVGIDTHETVPVGLVFRSIGYRGLPLPDVPFDQRKGTLPNNQGRILNPETGQTVPGEYAVGWIKRGPSGIIGTNKPDSMESVKMLLEDVAADALTPVDDAHADPASIEALLRERVPRYVSFAAWKKLDTIEVAKGAPQGRPRVKFTNVDEMLDVIDAT